MSFWKKPEDALDREIKKLEEEMASGRAHPSSETYANLLDRYERLCELRGKRNPPKIEPDTILKVGATLLELLLIMNFERIHVIATKAWGFVSKPRI